MSWPMPPNGRSFRVAARVDGAGQVQNLHSVFLNLQGAARVDHVDVDQELVELIGFVVEVVSPESFSSFFFSSSVVFDSQVDPGPGFSCTYKNH